MPVTAPLPPVSGCPGCVAVPAVQQRVSAQATGQAIILTLPTLHCAGCISTVETGLRAMPEVTEARVNLSQKRVHIDARCEVEAADLIEALGRLGYPAHELDQSALNTSAADQEARALLFRLGVAGFAMMNVMLLSVAVWSGAADATRDMFHWISAAIALPVVGYSAQPFFQNAMRALKSTRLNMDVPISLAIILAVGMSLYEVGQSGEHAYFDAALSLTFFLLAGRVLDQRTRRAARSAAQELSALEVPRAQRITSGGEETVQIADLRVGDVVRVKPGGRMPVDGHVLRGESEVDRSLLTGETDPVYIAPDTLVSAGEINLTGPVDVVAGAVGRDTSLQNMVELVGIAEGAKNRYSSLADRAAAIYAPGVHLLAFVAFLGWLWASGGDVRLALNIAVAVLIITCPCALGLAVPAVVAAASGRLFRMGLLVKDGTALERLAGVDCVVFDKTGTLTQGRPKPDGFDHLTPDEAALTYALAAASSHPLAISLADTLKGQGVEPAALTDVVEIPGRGVEARDEAGNTLRLGRADWVGADAHSGTATYLSLGAEPPHCIAFHDQLRAGAADLITGLLRRGTQVHLLSGDTIHAVQRVADDLGVEHWQAGISPEGKAEVIADLSASGRRVLMVGDGLNDTVALASAHVSISPASALDVARVASDIVLLGDDLGVIGDAIGTAKSATRRIQENFAIAAGYNMVAVPIALAGLATPLAAALAMSLSSISVSLNALRLR